MKNTKIYAKFLLLTVVLLSLVGCTSSQPVTKQIFAMDTYMELRAYGKNADTALSESVKAINEASRELDPELEGSAVYALNHADGQPVEVSDRIYNMLETANTVYQQSNGALDLTIYPVVKAWGFIDGVHTIPTADKLEQLKSVPCFDRISLQSNTVTMPKGTEISFGAVAKGAMAEEVAQIMRTNGVEHAYLSLGGNVQTIGLKPDGSKWRIGLQDPNNTSTHLGVIVVDEAAVVTSGSYQRFFEEDGKLYHHIIDPKTGAPSESGLKSATIVCESGTMADSLSTAMFILGEKGALEYRNTYGGFEMILVTDDNRVIVTSGLEFEPTSDQYTYETVD